MLLPARSDRVNTVIVDDDEMVRDALRLLVERIPGIRVVGTASNGREAIFLIQDLQPDLALIDILLPIRNGIEVAAEIHRQYPMINLMMLSDDRDHEYVVRSFKAGASAYVCKGGQTAELEVAVKAVIGGQKFISPVVTEELLADYLGSGSARTSELELLSEHERQLLQLVAEGATSKDIASVYGLSTRTIEKQRAKLMKKLGVNTIPDLVRFAMQTGLIHPAKKPS